MKKTIRIILNAVIVLMVFGVWILSFFFWRDSALGGSGWEDLKYFTVESNLFVGVVALAWLLSCAFGRQRARWLTVMKYISTAAVFVTFSVVVLFLGPLYGYGRMYYGANLFFHLLIPLLAIADFVFFEEGDISLRDSFLAMIPPLVYGVGYLTNCIVNGVGSWETVRNDWYSFLEWGYAVGAAIFVVICLISWGLGLSLRTLNKPARKLSWGEKK